MCDTLLGVAVEAGLQPMGGTAGGIAKGKTLISVDSFTKPVRAGEGLSSKEGQLAAVAGLAECARKCRLGWLFKRPVLACTPRHRGPQCAEG